MKRYMLERRALPNGLWREVGQYSTFRALQTAMSRDQRRPRGDPYEWQVTQLVSAPSTDGPPQAAADV